MNEGSCDKAAFKKREDGKLTTSSRRLYKQIQFEKRRIERRKFWQMEHEGDESWDYGGGGI